MEKIKVYFCENTDCVKDFLPCSFTFKEAIEHFVGTYNPRKIIVARGCYAKADELISAPEYVDDENGQPVVDIVYYTKMMNQ